MFPRIEKVIQLVERDSEKELLITHRETERVGTGLAVHDFGSYFEVCRELIYLVLVEVGNRLDTLSGLLCRQRRDFVVPLQRRDAAFET